MMRRGHNAGGTWDKEHGKAEYRVLPNKESPLWRRYSQVIYWWTATEDGPSSAYRIAYNGYVLVRETRLGELLGFSLRVHAGAFSRPAQ